MDTIRDAGGHNTDYSTDTVELLLIFYWYTHT